MFKLCGYYSLLPKLLASIGVLTCTLFSLGAPELPPPFPIDQPISQGVPEVAPPPITDQPAIPTHAYQPANEYQEIADLIQGYRNFRAKSFAGENHLFKDLKEGQSPKILVIACSDSRVDPAILFDTKPGDLFMVRNVANLVPPNEETNTYHGVSAALEFAVTILGVRHIVVLGHTQCGGIAEIFRQTQQDITKHNFISKWIELGRDACKTVIRDYPNEALARQEVLCGQYALRDSLKNLRTFPWIDKRVADKQLFLHAWQFDIISGDLHAFDELKGNYILL